MKRGLVTGTLLLATWAAPVRAAFIPVCCACVLETGTSQQEAPIPALFCANPTVGTPAYDAAQSQCADLGGSLQCDPQGEESCSVELLEAGFLCPPSDIAGVPALPPLGLATLAAGLGALGVGVLRRHQHRA